MYVSKQVCWYVCIHICICMHVFIYMYLICIYIYLYVCTYLCMCLYVSMYVYMHVFMHVCISEWINVDKERHHFRLQSKRRRFLQWIPNTQQKGDTNQEPRPQQDNESTTQTRLQKSLRKWRLVWRGEREIDGQRWTNSRWREGRMAGEREGDLSFLRSSFLCC